MELLNHVMVDLETWGTRPGSAIRSIGAVFFHPISGDISHTFYGNVCDRSCSDFGLVKDGETVSWWEGQSASAKAAFSNPEPRPLDRVLRAFNSWWAHNGGKFVWGHGANFDPVLLNEAFHACGLEAPWAFWNIRCCRTVLALGRRKPDRSTGTHHNALDDAKAQARAVAAVFRSKLFEPE